MSRLPLSQTLDMAGNIKFGPDVEHITRTLSVDKPGAVEEDDEEWWTKQLEPSTERLGEMAEAIRDYVCRRFSSRNDDPTRLMSLWTLAVTEHRCEQTQTRLCRDPAEPLPSG